MIQQTVFPFKLQRTEEKITTRSGLALFAEFFQAMGVRQLAERYMPKPRSGRGFEAIRYIKPLCMSMYGGGESIEDVREIREDDSLREAIELKRSPPVLPQGTGSRGRQSAGVWKALRRLTRP